MKLGMQAALLMALGLALVPFGQATGDHINTASIFELGASVRAIGMGGAFIAVADDGASVMYNPAGLPQLTTTCFTSLFTRPFGEFSYGAVGAAQSGWGAQLLILDSGALEERDLYGNPTDAFRLTESGFVLSVGADVGGGVSLGLQGKLHAVATPGSSIGAAVSPAIRYTEGPRTYSLVWRNALGTDLRFADGHTEPWMRDLAVGFAWRTDHMVYAVDFTEHLITRGELASVRAGVESRKFEPLILRAGTHREGSSFGVSVYRGAFRFDMAYVLHYTLSDSYYLSLKYRWDESLLDLMASPFRWLGSALRE